ERLPPRSANLPREPRLRSRRPLNILGVVQNQLFLGLCKCLHRPNYAQARIMRTSPWRWGAEPNATGAFQHRRGGHNSKARCVRYGLAARPGMSYSAGRSIRFAASVRISNGKIGPCKLRTAPRNARFLMRVVAGTLHAKKLLS